MKVKKKKVRSAATGGTGLRKLPYPSDIEYIQLYNTCVIKKEKIGEVDNIIDTKILANRARYENIVLLAKDNNAFLRFQEKPSLGSDFFKARPLFSLNNRNVELANHLDDIYNLSGASALLNGNNIFSSGKISTPALKIGGMSDFIEAPVNPANNSTNPFSIGLHEAPDPLFHFYSSRLVPWYFIACIHYLECGFSFKRHIHNGDPLTGYTTRVPAGRPKVGHAPPFTFEESAVDAIRFKEIDKIPQYNVPNMLRVLEKYNGFGYFSRKMNSPYLWSFSNQYTVGKYIKDKVFDKNAESDQVGAAVLLKRMEERGLIYIPKC